VGKLDLGLDLLMKMKATLAAMRLEKKRNAVLRKNLARLVKSANNAVAWNKKLKSRLAKRGI
jgi:hypothetical protein